MCPILFEEEKAELCRGHIVPQSAGGSDWVVQRKDVDNFFGSFAEADFAHGLKLRSSSEDERVEYISKRRLAHKIGLTKIGIDGSVSRMQTTLHGLRCANSNLDDIPGTLIFNPSMAIPTIISCLHMAHLGNFKLHQYTYAMNGAGQFIGHNILGHLYRRFKGRISEGRKMMFSKEDDDIYPIFTLCQNLVRPIPQETLPLVEDVTNNPFNDFHVAWVDKQPFAIIHYLKFGSECYAVLMPTTFDQTSAALICSLNPLSFTLGKGMYSGNNSIEVGPHDTNAVWPCGNGSEGDVIPLIEASVMMGEAELFRSPPDGYTGQNEHSFR